MTGRGFMRAGGALWVGLTAACVIGPREVPAEDAPTETAAVYCGQMFDCPCDDGRIFINVNDCENSVENSVERIMNAGRQAGLQYDPTCLGDFVGTIEALGCGTVSSPGDGCRPSCNVFHGTRRSGETCQYFDEGLHDCAKGLDCNGETCSSRCTAPAGIGESCEETPCADGLDCGDDQRCEPGVPLKENGEPCTGHQQCQSLNCPIGCCAPVPQRGEECPAGICDVGLQCNGETCVDADAAICFLGTPF